MDAHGRCLAFVFLWILSAGLPACAAREAAEPFGRSRGIFPDTGRVVIRSGLAWLGEEVPVFRPLAGELKRLLEARGLSVVSVASSKLAPTPETPVPDAVAPEHAVAYGAMRYEAAGDMRARTRAAELARKGRLPPLKLGGYNAPARDKDLAESVKRVRPPDVAGALFALSQQRGAPALRGGPLPPEIPGRMPAELQRNDPASADYGLLVRFARLLPPARSVPLGGGGVSGTSGRVGGVGALGFGTPARGTPSVGRGSHANRGAYARGYIDTSPGQDIWNRDAAARTRDYARSLEPPPAYATPPEPLSGSGAPGITGPGGDPGGDVYGYAPLGAVTGGVMLELELYDLAPARAGQEPRRIWKARAVMPDPDSNALPMDNTLPELANMLLGK